MKSFWNGFSEKIKLFFGDKKKRGFFIGGVLLLAVIVLSCIIFIPKTADPNCVDGSCDIPEYDEAGKQVYAIVSPVGYNNIEKIEQAPRLDTLSGKNIAIVGGSFMASTTHAELKKCILEKYPDAHVYTMSEVGSGGPFSVFGKSAQTERFEEKLKELEIDAVISGNCGCGLCTTKETGSSIAAEYLGIPTVTVGAPTFIPQIHSTGVNRGVPVLRTAEYPNAFASESNSALVKNAREILWPQVEKALTEPITDAEIQQYANQGERPYDEIVYYGSYDDIQEYCKINDWTDGNPIVPPTDALIREYLEFTPYEAEAELGTYALAYRKCLTYTVAANAVMAGVPKEYMPVCVAIAQCLENGEFRRPLASTHGWSPYAWLNGPLGRQLGINHEQGMISEAANKSLGRFIDFAMLNLGGYYVKENRMGTFGYLTPWTFSEDEETCLSIGWDPYHVTQGYDLNSNTITAGSALTWGNNVTPATDDPEQIMKLLAFDITEKQQNGLGNTNPQVYRTVFITAPVAKDLATKYGTKNSLEDALIETARRPLWMRTYANYWANTGSQQFDKYTFEQYYNKLLNDPEEMAGLTDTPEWMKGFVQDSQIMTIGTMKKFQTPLLVTGDGDRNKFQVMPGGGYVTIEIKLPENWNELVAPLGYQPIEDFYLSKDSAGSDEKEKEETKETKSESGSSGITAENLSDGTYRLTPALDKVTGEGRAFYSDGELSVFKGGQAAPVKVSGNFKKLLEILNPGSAITVTSSQVSGIILRPSSIEKKPMYNLSKLSSLDLSGIAFTLTVNLKQSAEGGGVTLDGASLVLPSNMKNCRLVLPGEILSGHSNSDLVTLSGNDMTFNTSVSAGSFSKFGFKAPDGQIHTLNFVLNDNATITVTYAASGNLD